MSDSLGDRTIRDFGEQWGAWGDNEGYYASVELLQDILGPLLPVEDLRGLRAADVGSGTGRIAHMLLQAGVAHVIALEPSQGVEALRRNLAPYGERSEVLHARGERLPAGRDLDLVTSIGVIQFIPDPLPTLRAALDALRPGGRLVLWVYAREGLGGYALASAVLRAFSTRAPHFVLDALCSLLNALLDLYIPLCRVLPRSLPVPLRSYVLNHLSRIDRETRKLTVYDQLNPAHVVLYRREEIEALVLQAGFVDPRCHHRHGYSWTVLAVKPDAPA